MLDCPLSTVKTRLYQGLAVSWKQLEKQACDQAAAERETL